MTSKHKLSCSIGNISVYFIFIHLKRIGINLIHLLKWKSEKHLIIKLGKTPSKSLISCDLNLLDFDLMLLDKVKTRYKGHFYIQSR